MHGQNNIKKIKMDVMEICWGVDWIDRILDMDRCKRVKETWDSIECGDFFLGGDS
jgi:hypothetical protein